MTNSVTTTHSFEPPVVTGYLKDGSPVWKVQVANPQQEEWIIAELFAKAKSNNFTITTGEITCDDSFLFNNNISPITDTTISVTFRPTYMSSYPQTLEFTIFGKPATQLQHSAPLHYGMEFIIHINNGQSNRLSFEYTIQ